MKAFKVSLYFLVLLFCSDVFSQSGRCVSSDLVLDTVAELYEKAQEGDRNAQCYLGFRYQNEEKNYPEAAYWYEQAAEQGHEKAQIFLGGLYQEGRGVEQSCEKAAYWYRQALEQGNTLNEESVEIFEKSCE